MRWIVLVLLASAMAGCANDDGSGDGEPTATDTTTTSPSTSTSSSSTTTTTAPPKRDPVTWDLDIEDNSFPDGSITVQVGDTVRWTHMGSNPHTVTSRPDSQEPFDSGSDTVLDYMQSGDTFSYTFEEVGENDYRCEVHTSMTGTITVLERYDEVP